MVIVIKVCADVTCANNGTCKDTMSGFKCTCAPEYKGPTCEEGRNNENINADAHLTSQTFRHSRLYSCRCHIMRLLV